MCVCVCIGKANKRKKGRIEWKINYLIIGAQSMVSHYSHDNDARQFIRSLWLHFDFLVYLFAAGWPEFSRASTFFYCFVWLALTIVVCTLSSVTIFKRFIAAHDNEHIASMCSKIDCQWLPLIMICVNINIYKWSARHRNWKKFKGAKQRKCHE